MMKANALKRNLLIGVMLLFVAVFVAPGRGLANLDDGLVAYWSFDEGTGSIVHSSVGGYNGTIYGATWTTNGACGNALQFDGSNDYVSVPDDDAWAFGSNNFTIMVWANFDQPGHGTITNPGDFLLANNEGHGSHNKWVFALGGGVLEFVIDKPGIGPTYLQLCSFSPVVGQWYQLSVTRSGNTYTVFVNGEERGSVVNTRTIPNANVPLTIGAGEDWGGYMGGRLDEVRIYDRALSEEEICQLYNTYGPWDQNKLYFDPVFQTLTLYFTDGDADTCHDPGEPYFAGPDPNANALALDMSCWMASASNIMQHECQGNYYLSWLRDGAAPSPSTSPWGVVINACGGNGGDHMTFDDGGWQHWALDHAGCLYSGPITTTTESGTWSINPIDWCRNRLASDHLIGIIIYWGKLPPDALPGWIDPMKQGGYHAITLWDIDPVAGTLTITDSDDQFVGQSVLSYTFTNNDWVIQNWNPGQNAHINYAVSSRSESDGDVNNDGVINAADVVYLINYLYIHGPAPVPLEAGDVNCDGTINAADVVYLINYLYIGGPPPGC